MNAKAVKLQQDIEAIEIGQVIDFTELTNKKVLQKNIVNISIETLIRKTISFLASIIGILILIPLTLVIFIANKIVNDNGPIFYTQERIGKNGKIFKMIKYRSMVIDADKRLEKYLNENKEAKNEFDKYKKLKNDPRITKVGKFLRKTSLDEMPQMINIFLGQMTFVGPRPYLPQEKKDMGEYYDIIIKHTPGLTGLWQISGRSDRTFEDRLNLDLKYDETKSFIQDLKILFKTVLHVIKKEGAI